MAEEFTTDMLFGEITEKGAVTRDVKHTAIPEGLRVEPGDVMVHIDGTTRFYYVKGPVFSRLKPEERAEVEAKVKGTMTTSVVQPSQPTTPASNTFSNKTSSKKEDKDVTNDNSSN